jgi:hypothetical protein
MSPETETGSGLKTFEAAVCITRRSMFSYPGACFHVPVDVRLFCIHVYKMHVYKIHFK